MKNFVYQISYKLYGFERIQEFINFSDLMNFWEMLTRMSLKYDVLVSPLSLCCGVRYFEEKPLQCDLFE